MVNAKRSPLFPLKLITPTGVVFDGLVEQVNAVDPQGEFGVLADHIIFIASLVLGRLSIKRAEGGNLDYLVSDGLAQVDHGAMTITTTGLEQCDEPDLAVAIAERAAKARLQELEAEMNATQHTLELARNRRRSPEQGH
jgi:F-type H+-transporting ATPase subunit epsilon